jgi:hypothetical protein
MKSTSLVRGQDIGVLRSAACSYPTLKSRRIRKLSRFHPRSQEVAFWEMTSLARTASCDSYDAAPGAAATTALHSRPSWAPDEIAGVVLLRLMGRRHHTAVQLVWNGNPHFPRAGAPQAQSPGASEGYGCGRYGVRGRLRGPSGSPRFRVLPPAVPVLGWRRPLRTYRGMRRIRFAVSMAPHRQPHSISRPWRAAPLDSRVPLGGPRSRN